MWLVWHFYYMPKFLFSIWKNYLYFSLDFFSAPLLLATLFSPWRKYRWTYPRGFSIGEYFNTFVSNVFSRLIGALCRLVLVVLGLAGQFLVLMLGALALVLWFALPLIWIALLIILIYGYPI